MKITPFRIMAVILLAITLIAASGIASTAATLLDTPSHSSCCDADDERPVPKGPCSTPDCPCFSCTTMILPQAITLLSPSAVEGEFHVFTGQFHLSDYVAAIEYPPETV